MAMSKYFPAFFNQKSESQATVQAINALAFTAAAINLVFDPAEFWTLGLDLAVHGFTIMALSSDDVVVRQLAFGLNFARAGAIYTNGFSFTSLLDFGLHIGNSYPILVGEAAEKRPALSPK